MHSAQNFGANNLMTAAFLSRSNFGLRDINMEMVTKVVPVRTVELSIGAFCTEFRCEQLYDNGALLGSGSFCSASRHKHRNVHEKGRHESCGALDRCILHRNLVRTTL